MINIPDKIKKYVFSSNRNSFYVYYLESDENKVIIDKSWSEIKKDFKNSVLEKRNEDITEKDLDYILDVFLSDYQFNYKKVIKNNFFNIEKLINYFLIKKENELRTFLKNKVEIDFLEKNLLTGKKSVFEIIFLEYINKYKDINIIKENKYCFKLFLKNFSLLNVDENKFFEFLEIYYNNEKKINFYKEYGSYINYNNNINIINEQIEKYLKKNNFLSTNIEDIVTSEILVKIKIDLNNIYSLYLFDGQKLFNFKTNLDDILISLKKINDRIYVFNEKETTSIKNIHIQPEYENIIKNIISNLFNEIKNNKEVKLNNFINYYNTNVEKIKLLNSVDAIKIETINKKFKL